MATSKQRPDHTYYTMDTKQQQFSYLKQHDSPLTSICDRLRENRAQRGVRKYREKIDRFLKNVLFQAEGRERLGLL